MKKLYVACLKLRQRGYRGNGAATEPERDAQTETPAIGDSEEFFELVD